MATFGGVTFYFTMDAPGRAADSEVTEFHIPESDVTILDEGGKLAPHVARTAYFETQDDYDDMEALVGTHATLTCWDGTYTAYLKRMSRKERYPSGEALADVEFILG